MVLVPCPFSHCTVPEQALLVCCTRCLLYFSKKCTLYFVASARPLGSRGLPTPALAIARFGLPCVGSARPSLRPLGPSAWPTLPHSCAPVSTTYCVMLHLPRVANIVLWVAHQHLCCRAAQNVFGTRVGLPFCAAWQPNVRVIMLFLLRSRR